jgi:hypothetical protein
MSLKESRTVAVILECTTPQFDDCIGQAPASKDTKEIFNGLLSLLLSFLSQSDPNSIP